MQTLLVVLSFGGAFVLALYVLYQFHAKAWYWHVLSVLAAIGIGIVPVTSLPLPQQWVTSPSSSIVIGFFFIFLLIWGIGAPFFRAHHAPRQATHA